MNTILQKLNRKKERNKNLDLSLNLKETEKELVIKAISNYTTMMDASKALGISERTLYRKLKEFKLV